MRGKTVAVEAEQEADGQESDDGWMLTHVVLRRGVGRKAAGWLGRTRGLLPRPMRFFENIIEKKFSSKMKRFSQF